MFKKLALSFLSALTAISPMTAAAADGSFTVRIPVETVAFVPTTTTYDFGKVLVGQTPQRVLTFYNQSSDPVTITSLDTMGAAQVVSSTCSGEVATGRSCTFTAALSVSREGANQGVVQVRHTGAVTPDDFVLKATGVKAAGLVTSLTPMVDFGNTELRVPVGPKSITLKNVGDSAVDLLDVRLTEGSSTFTLRNTDCYYLEPGDTCTVQVTYDARVQGLSQGRVSAELDDGSVVQLASLAGTVALGTPVWSTSQLTYNDVPVGVPTADQVATVTNAGKGTLSVTRLRIIGDSVFQLSKTDCPAKLAPNQSCSAHVRALTQDNALHSGTLQFESTNSTNPSLGLMLFVVPAEQKAALTLEPNPVDFGAVPLADTATREVILRSTGTKPANVTAYSLGGAHAGDFRILNPEQCTGSLPPGMQCTLRLAATPTASGPRTGQLSLTADTPEPVAPVTLKVQGVTGTLVAIPGRLDFGDVEVGKSATLTTTLKNEGGAPVSISDLTTDSATAANYRVTGCTGVALQPAGTCVASVTFTPTAPGNASGTVLVKNTGTPDTVTVTLSGSGKAAALPLGSLSPFTCPNPAQLGTLVTCTATLTNIGTVPLSVDGAPTRSNTAFNAPTSDCPASLTPGAQCTVTLTGTFNTAGSYSTNVSVPSSAGPVTSSAAVTVRAPELTLTTRAHDTARATESNTQTHTLTNTGAFTVTVTMPAVATTTVRPGASVAPAGFTVDSSTCSTTLAAGASCTVTTRFSPDKPGAYSGTLTVNASATGWSGAASGGLNGVASNAPDTTMWLEAVPNPVDWGLVSSQLSAPVEKVVTIYNRSTSTAAANFGLTLGGPQAAEVNIVAQTCSTTLASGASCTVTLGFLPRGAGDQTHTAELRVRSSLPELVVPLTLRTMAGTLTPSNSALDFGAVKIGTSRTLSVTFTNTGNAPVSRSAATITGTDAGRFSVNSTASTCPATIAVGGTCLMDVTFTPTALPAVTATLAHPHQGFASPTTVALSGSGLPADVPAGVLSNFTCTSPLQPGMSFSCTATITSTGTAPLSVTTATRTGTTFGAPVLTGCSTSMVQGTSCTVSLGGTAPAAGTYSTDVTVTTNAGALTKPAQIVVGKANVTLAMQDHGAVQIGSSNTATHVLSNQGPGSLSLGSVLPTVSTAPFSYVSKTCGATLAAGSSCEIVTRCSPTAATAGSRNGTLTVSSAFETFTGTLSCDGQQPRLDVVSSTSGNVDVGGHSRPGNWITLRNSGAGPVTIQALRPFNADWTMFANDATQHCTVNRVLAAGEQCLVLETLATARPGTVAQARNSVQTSAGAASWDSQMTVFGVAIQPLPGFDSSYTNTASSGVYQVTNLAPYQMTGGSISLSSAAFTVGSHNCTTLAPAGSAGSSCLVTLNATSVTTAGTSQATLSVTGSYPQVINRQVFAPVNSGVQGTLNVTRTVVAPSLTWTVGTYPATPVGGSSDTVSTLRNDGAISVNFTADGYIGANTAHTLTSTTCRGELRPGTSCEYRTRFSPTATSVNNTQLHAPLDIGLRSASLLGNVMQPSDVSVTVTDGVASTYAYSNTTFVMTVTNPGAGKAVVQLTFGDTVTGQATVVNRSAATCAVASGGTCSVQGNQATLDIPARGTATVRQTLTYGPNDGVVTMKAKIDVSEVDDTNLANNEASDSTDIVGGVAPWDGSGDVCGQFGAVTPDLKLQCAELYGVGKDLFRLHDPNFGRILPQANSPQSSFLWETLGQTTKNPGVWYTTMDKVGTNGIRYLAVVENPVLSSYDNTSIMFNGRLSLMKFNSAGSLVANFNLGAHGKGVMLDIDTTRARLYAVYNAGYANPVMKIFDLNTGALIKDIVESKFPQPMPGSSSGEVFRIDETTGDIVWFGSNASSRAITKVFRMNPSSESVAVTNFPAAVSRGPIGRTDRVVLHGNRMFMIDNIPGGDQRYQLRRINLTSGESKIVWDSVASMTISGGDTLYFGHIAGYAPRGNLKLLWQ